MAAACVGAAVAVRSLIGADTETMTCTVMSDGGRVTPIVARGQQCVAVTGPWQASTLSHTRTVAVEHVANVAVETRHEHCRRRSQ